MAETSEPVTNRDVQEGSIVDRIAANTPFTTGHLVSASSIASIVLLWAVMAPFYPDAVIPSPLAVVTSMWGIIVGGEFLVHTAATVYRVLIGFFAAFAVSVFIGVSMGLNKTLEDFLKVEVLVGLTIPGLIWVIVSAMWFGLTEFAMIFSITIIIAPLLALNMWEGTKDIDTGLMEMGSVFDASIVENLRHVILPQLIPYLLSGTRLGLSLGWKVAVIAELVMADKGVGFKLNYHFGLFNMTMILAWALLFTILMLLLEFGVIYPIEQRITAWRPTEHEQLEVAVE